MIAHTDVTGARIQTNTYDAYGIPGASNDGLFQYTGQIWLEDAGVYHYKARAYHAELGVFMQTDPIGHSGGINLYAYVGGDPVNFTDPWGLKAEPDPDEEPEGDPWECDWWEHERWRNRAICVTVRMPPPMSVWVNSPPPGTWYGDAINAGWNAPDGGGRPWETDEVGPGRDHFFQITVTSYCSEEALFEAIRQPGRSAPGAPYARAGTNNVLLFNDNLITQTVDVEARTIHNRTRPPHQFHPGDVFIEFGSTGRASFFPQTEMTITGTGTGANALYNEVLGSLFFYQAASQATATCAFYGG